jgi:hypothetical protein
MPNSDAQSAKRVERMMLEREKPPVLRGFFEWS